MKRPRIEPSPRPGASLLVLFFLSGAAGLSYEILWQEELALICGRSWEATATVLAVFMGGLALGAALAGRFVDRLRVPLLVYSFLETGLALAALLVPWILTRLEPLYQGAWHALGEGPLLAAVRVALAAAALLPATLAMGATLPVLSRFAAGGNFGRELPRLYGANTLGAALGALATSFILVPTLGRSATLLVAVTLTLAVAFFAARLAKAGPVIPSRRREAEKAPAETTPLHPILPLVAFLSGATILGLEVFWTHHLALTFGSSVYAFGLMLGAILTGLGLASLVCARWTGAGRDPWTLVLFSLGAGAVAVVVTTAALGALPWLSAWLVKTLSRWFLLFSAVRFLVAFLLLGLPALLLGLTLPALVVAARRAGREGAGTATIYAANTVGAVIGPLVAGYLLLPTLGTRTGMLAAAGLLLLLALAAALHRGGRTLPAAGAATLTGVVLVLALPAWDTRVTTSGFHLYALHHTNETLDQALARRTPLEVLEGVHGTVAVFDFKTRSGETRRTYSMNGKYEGSTNERDMLTQTRVSEMALLASHRPPRDVYLLGLGTGASLAAILRYPVERVDLCELSPQVCAMARRHFADYNNRCLEDARVNLVVADGRHWLRMQRRRWDVIISEPSNPWMAGVASLFTEEAFRTMRGRVRPGGVVCQWVQGYLLSEATFRMVLRTWLTVFPDSFAAMPHFEVNDIFLVGRVPPEGEEGPAPLDARTLARRLAGRRPWAFGEPFAPKSVNDLFHAYLMGPEGLATWAGRTGATHTDDHPRLQYQAPLNLYRKEAELKHWSRLAPLVEPPHDLLAGLTPAQEKNLFNGHVNLVLYLLLKGASQTSETLSAQAVARVIERMDRLARSPRCADPWLPLWIKGHFQLYGRARDGLCRRFGRGWRRGRALETLSLATRADPSRWQPYLDMAQALERGVDGRPGGRGSAPEDALKVIAPALRLKPDLREGVLLRSRLQFALGRRKEARRTLERYLRLKPGDRRALDQLEIIRSQTGEQKK